MAELEQGSKFPLMRCRWAVQTLYTKTSVQGQDRLYSFLFQIIDVSHRPTIQTQ